MTKLDSFTGAIGSSATAPAPTSASDVTVSYALSKLDTSWSKFASAFANDEYALWLGSAISKDSVPGLWPLMAKLLESLRTAIEPTNLTCSYRKALKKIIALADLIPKAERDSIDYTQTVESWTLKDRLIEALINKYAHVLNVSVDGKELDYLYWDLLDLPNTYAADALKPDAEHLCIAILALEGAVSKIASANWDALIENACMQLGGPAFLFQVSVNGAEARGTTPDAIIVKFHGCALKAKQNQTAYRKHIVARHPQIDGWVEESIKKPVVQEIVSILKDKKTLMVGLSAQDANIRNIFPKAAAVLAWNWPSEPPACVFAGEAVNPDQLAILENVYATSCTAANRSQIEEASLFQSYSKALFTALTLKTLSYKLNAYLSLIPESTLPKTEVENLGKSISFFRDYLAKQVDKIGYLDFVGILIKGIYQGLSVYRRGMAPIDGGAPSYEPLDRKPASRSIVDPSFLESGNVEISVLVALLGRGLSEGLWSIVLDETPEKISFQVLSKLKKATFSFVRDSHIRLKLTVEEDILIQGLEIIEAAQRSPRPAPRLSKREFSIRKLLQDSKSADELFQQFRYEAAI